MTYTYDALHRLKTSETTGSTDYPKWGLTWSYDRYGNRTNQAILSGCVAPMTCPTNTVTVDTATNRINQSPYAYDPNGNMTNDGSNTLAYDAASRLISAAAATYTYDGGALRVKKVSGATTTVYVFSGAKVIAEYENGAAVGSPTREYIYTGSQLLAKIEGGTTTYSHPDHLSARVMTSTSGSIVAQSGHFPFGENWFESGGTNKLKFTSYERDSESGNDYAIFRSHISRLGRFSSPDLLSGSIGNPQSLNRFTYVTNDPINLVDPLGLEEVLVCFVDGMPWPCNMAMGLVERGWGFILPPGVGATGFATDRNGHPHAYIVTWTVGDDSPQFSYPGLSPGQIEALGLLRAVTQDLQGGRGNPQRERVPYVDSDVLDECTRSLFTVTTAAFKASKPRQNGYFIGIGRDDFGGRGSNVPIVVSNNATRYDAAQIAQISGVPNAVGFTDRRFPYENYTNNNNNLIGTLRTQVHELGHSLFTIGAGSSWIPEPRDMGKALEDCVLSGGGFRRR